MLWSFKKAVAQLLGTKKFAPPPFEYRVKRQRPSRPTATRTKLNVTPLEDRTNPTPVVTIAAIQDGAEGGANVVFELTRTDTTGSLEVMFYFGGTATPNDDFEEPFGAQVFFADGKATTTLPLSVLDDDLSEPADVPEPTETVIVTLQESGMDPYTIGTPGSATANIFDNDTPEVTVVKIQDVVEGETDDVFRFTRIGDLSSSLAVNYSVGGSATSGTDYTALSGSVTFAAGKATADVTVKALHDGVEDDDETVTVTVGTGTGYTSGSPNQATVTIMDVPDFLPVAFNASVTSSMNDEVEVDVLELATDLDGDELTVLSVTQGTNGTVVDNKDGTVTYTPDTDYHGDDTFTYTVEDPFGNEETGTITVTVTSPLAPPTSVWTAENTAVTVDVLEMAFDPDEDTLITTAVTQGGYGSVVINLDDSVTYTPNTSFTGQDSFTYTVEDPYGNEATHTITVTVGETDPVALDDEVETEEDTPVNVDVAELSYQPAGGSLTTISVTQGADGTVVIETDGSVTYTPDTSFTGTDTFTYTVEDANSNTATGTITVTVGTPAPTAVDDILDMLTAIDDEIENYDEGTPAALLAALPDLVDGIGDYRDAVTSFVSVNSIGQNGANKAYKDLVEQMVPVYNDMYKKHTELKEVEARLWSAMEANADLIWILGLGLNAAKQAGNAGQIAALQTVIDNLVVFQSGLFDQWDKTYVAGADLAVQLKETRDALIAGSPPGGVTTLLALKLPVPTAFPERIYARVIPKLP